MNQFFSSVSSKGQVTVPQEVRRLLKLRPGDRVEFRVEGGRVLIEQAKSALAEHFQSIPALQNPLSDEEAIRVATDEHADAATQEGL